MTSHMCAATANASDNREQLKMIEDSVRYALSDPNVEISRIDICGYASPESPYMHNEYLATNRSRSLSEYIGRRFSLPADRCTYSSVPENWAEFRELAVAADDITEAQRRDLLELIDTPAYGASDYDAKEKELKTDRRFASLLPQQDFCRNGSRCCVPLNLPSAPGLNRCQTRSLPKL